MKELDSRYNPHDFEKRIYDEWVKNDLFSPSVNEGGKPYTIMMPPPNVTGNLHIGHSMYTLQDIYIRLKRMQGYQALWLPGTDHASIATESRVVNKIRKSGKTKEELGREGFLKEAWDWTHEHGGTIVEQLKSTGFSCDWDRLKFTLDDNMSHAVYTAFKMMYDGGFIYKGDRIINWCPDCKTAISDAEVDHIDTESKIWEIKYPYADGTGAVVVATTRPETMLGDLAVAVNPDDERYKAIVGKKVILPLLNKEIPVISDSYVDMEFGTGVVKITPSHDPNDFAVGERHNLGQLTVIDESAHMNENAGKYAGMDRYEARKAILNDLKNEGLLVSEKKHDNAVGHCSRCKTVIEPLISKQWFVKMKELAADTLDAFEKGEPKFYPDRFGKIYRNWLENLNDWCISRQLWWGHQIPAYYCDDCGHIMVSETKVEKCEKCNSTHVHQDPDTLDTWFSSGLWPFATLGWPDTNAEDFKKFFPTDLLITGFDIILFWVIRMTFMSKYFLDEIPFKDVLITGLVRDLQGRKMSKSLDNGIDPLEIIDKYGADALRFNMVTGNSPGNDMRFDEKKVENARNFANKVWNASRFLLMNIGTHNSTDFDESKLTAKDFWILEKLNDVITTVDKNLSKYEVGLAAERIYSFIWEDLCDYYIEFTKSDLYGGDEDRKSVTKSVLLYVLENSLKLLHPFMPFITEEIYQSLPNADGYIMVKSWPKAIELNDKNNSVFVIEKIKDLIREVRNAKASRNIDPSKKSELILVGNDKLIDDVIKNKDMIMPLIQVTDIIKTDEKLNPSDYLFMSLPEFEMYMPLKELIDYNKEKENLEKKIKDYNAEIERLDKKLSNKGFVDKAPEAVVEKEREKLRDYKSLLDSVTKSLEEIKRVLW